MNIQGCWNHCVDHCQLLLYQYTHQVCALVLDLSRPHQRPGSHHCQHLLYQYTHQVCALVLGTGVTIAVRQGLGTTPVWIEQLMVHMIHRQVSDAPCVAQTATAAVTFLPHSR